MGFTKWFNEQSKLVRILLLIPIWGWVFGILLRVFKFVETKSTTALVGAILCVVPFVGQVMGIVDFVMMIVKDSLGFLAE